MSKLEKFVALYDLHWGYARKNGHKVPVHDPRAINIAMAFIKDFRPDHVILGGDMLDCRAISHHTKGKTGEIEGLRIFGDAKELRSTVLTPLEKDMRSLTYIIGNHEDWLNDLILEQPGLDGIVDPASILGLGKRWKVVENGGYHRLGKLTFIHGDQVSGGEHAAKNATIAYERNVRFGHFHTFQTYTKTTAVDAVGHTGISVPCLCKKDPSYGNGAPNKWMQGFLWGYLNPENGTFNDYITIIVNSRAIINGKEYTG